MISRKAGIVIMLILPVLTGFSPGATDQHTIAGVHIRTQFQKNCQRMLTQINDGKKVCIAPNAIIGHEEFAFITPIRNIQGRKTAYFNLVFTDKGFATLKKLYSELPASELVLVIDDKVVGNIKNMDVIRNRTLRIDGQANSPDLLWVHEHLKTVVAERQD